MADRKDKGRKPTPGMLGAGLARNAGRALRDRGQRMREAHDRAMGKRPDSEGNRED